MRLDIASIEISDIQFGNRTAVDQGTLFVNQDELTGLLAQDKRFAAVELCLARPGESTRIIGVFDVIEPRAKLGGGSNFPGIVDGLNRAGSGTTRALKGASVVLLDQLIKSTDGFGAVIDMKGAGAKLGLYGRNCHLVIDARPAPGTSRYDYLAGLRQAGLKAAVYLAQPEQEMAETGVQTYELPCPDLTAKPDALRIGYLFQIFSRQYDTAPGEAVLYGGGTVDMLPTIIHPNEILDGALVKGYAETGFDTYTIQNHPVIIDLYKRSSPDLVFAGMVIANSSVNEAERARNALLTAGLFSSALSVNGVVMTKIFGGASNIDLAATADRLEELGIKAVPIIQVVAWESNLGDVLLFNTPSLDAVVCSGWIHQPTSLSAVERVIGGRAEGPLAEDKARGEIQIERRYVKGAINNLGASGAGIAQY
jgi:glycine reductase